MDCAWLQFGKTNTDSQSGYAPPVDVESLSLDELDPDLAFDEETHTFRTCQHQAGLAIWMERALDGK